jgi:hypothetical protein
MAPDTQLLVIFGGLHLVALMLGAVLFVMFLRSDTASTWVPPDDEDSGGGGGNDRITNRPKGSPTGGIPLPDAIQARVRLRSRHDHLVDLRPRPVRRHVVEPGRVRPLVPQR